MVGREELDVGRAAAVELGEEGFEPVGLLVVDGDGEWVWHGSTGYDVWGWMEDSGRKITKS